MYVAHRKHQVVLNNIEFIADACVEEFCLIYYLFTKMLRSVYLPITTA